MPYQVEIFPRRGKGNHLISNSIQKELKDRECHEIYELSLSISDKVSVHDFSGCPVIKLADCCTYKECVNHQKIWDTFVEIFLALG